MSRQICFCFGYTDADKTDSGKKGFVEKWLAESSVPRDLVDEILDDHMCCYSLKTPDA